MVGWETLYVEGNRERGRSNRLESTTESDKNLSAARFLALGVHCHIKMHVMGRDGTDEREREGGRRRVKK